MKKQKENWSAQHFILWLSTQHHLKPFLFFIYWVKQIRWYWCMRKSHKITSNHMESIDYEKLLRSNCFWAEDAKQLRSCWLCCPFKSKKQKTKPAASRCPGPGQSPELLHGSEKRHIIQNNWLSKSKNSEMLQKGREIEQSECPLCYLPFPFSLPGVPAASWHPKHQPQGKQGSWDLV